MSVQGGWLNFSAWSDEERRWYADLVLQSDESTLAAHEPSEVLDQLNAVEWTKCLPMLGDASLSGRYVDTALHSWGADRYGRWSAKIGGEKKYLHHLVAELQPNRPYAPRAGDRARSHLAVRDTISHRGCNLTCLT